MGENGSQGFINGLQMPRLSISNHIFTAGDAQGKDTAGRQAFANGPVESLGIKPVHLSIYGITNGQNDHIIQVGGAARERCSVLVIKSNAIWACRQWRLIGQMMLCKILITRQRLLHH